MVTGCHAQTDPSKALNGFVDYVNGLKQYELKGEMVVVRDNNDIKFLVEVCYLEPAYYKVVLDNEQNNNRQIIIKNDDGVYVLTPALNKEFKFDSDWPLNSSHSYLLNSLVKDITNDTNSSATIDGDNVVIKSQVNHKTNKNLSYQKITCDKATYKPKSIVVYDAKDNPCLKLTLSSFSEKPGLSKTNFDVKKTMEDNVSYMSDGYLTAVNGELVVSNVIEGANLKNELKEDDVTIMCFTGEKEYTVICRKTQTDRVATPVRIYDDFVLMNEGLAVLTTNSLTFFNQDLEVCIVSASLTAEEMVNVAHSLTWV